jgi:hypothetical protein
MATKFRATKEMIRALETAMDLRGQYERALSELEDLAGFEIDDFDAVEGTDAETLEWLAAKAGKA